MTDASNCGECGNTCTTGQICEASSCEELCGNGTLNAGEDCDDGNLNPDDGCSALCAFELNAFEPDSTSAAANVLPPDGTTTTGHSILGPGDQDYFSLSLHDTVMTLFDTDGATLLNSDDNSGTGDCSALTVTPSVTGTYFIRISGFNDVSTGDYDISANIDL